MSEANFTNGPWKRDRWGAIVDLNGNAIRFRGVSILCSGNSEDIEEADKNTDLAAAAPELLEALKTLYEETADYIERNNLGDVHHNLSMRLARDALNKATGA